MSEENDIRLWKTLDDISNRLSGIESQLSDVVRLEERMNNHDNVLSRYGKRLDNNDTIIRNIELWQANHGDKFSSEKTLSDIQDEIKLVKEELTIVKSSNDRGKGQRDITKEILKVVVAILIGVVVYKFTRG